MNARDADSKASIRVHSAFGMHKIELGDATSLHTELML